MTVIIFLIVLSVLVFVHELGHFLAAKLSGVKVDEFALGFPPRIWSKTRGEVTYSLNAIPFGGYVKIPGENGMDPKDVDPEQKHRYMSSQPRYRQAIIMVAGIVFNLVFAWLLITATLMLGTPTIVDTAATDIEASQTIVAVSPGGLIDEAGLQPGDRIKTVLLTGQDGETSAIDASTDAIKNALTTQSITNAVIDYSRSAKGQQVDKSVSITNEDGAPIDQLGFAVESVGIVRYGFFPAISQGFTDLGQMIIDTFNGFISLFKKVENGGAEFSQVSGPVGLAQMVGQARALGFSYLLWFTALISVNLAILNLMPLPALDGGRIVVVLIESIRRKSLPHKTLGIVHGIGFALLLLLMLAVTAQDIIKAL